MRIAIIGSTKAEDEACQMMEEISTTLLDCGIDVSTGGAFKIDHAAMKGYRPGQKGKLYVYLPWSTYNKEIIPVGAITRVYSPDTDGEWTASVLKYHPNPNALSRGVWALHARNYGIVADPEPVNAIFALPRTLTTLGGTGQGMRIGEGLGIPVYNFRKQDHVDKIYRWLEEVKAHVEKEQQA
ncbi:hypothetical protein D3C78_19690 [compost metagenome]